jgi:hypothetical protein
MIPLHEKNPTQNEIFRRRREASSQEKIIRGSFRVNDGDVCEVDVSAVQGFFDGFEIGLRIFGE